LLLICNNQKVKDYILKFIQALILCLLCGHWCTATSKIINYNGRSTIFLKQYFGILEDDKNGLLTADLLFNKPELFNSFNDFSPTKLDDPFWLYTEIQSSNDEEVVLSFKNLASAILFVLPDTAGASYQQHYAGAFCPDSLVSNGDSRFHFQLTLVRGMKYRILIRSQHSKRYNPIFDFELNDSQLFYTKRAKKERLDYWFQGAGILLLVYILANGLITKYRPYIWMAVFITGLLMYNLALNRYFIDWFFPNNPIAGWRLSIHFLHIATAGLYLLIIDFWKIKTRSPGLYRLGKFILYGIPVLSLLSFFINYYFANFKLTSQINSCLFLVQLYYLIRLLSLWKGFDKQERYLAYGIVLYLAVALFVSSAVLTTGERFLTLIPFFSGLVQTVVSLLFLIGINGKLWQNEADKLLYQQQLNDLQYKQNQLLETSVKERTQELQHGKMQIELLIDELNHRVKNNLQLLYSLNSLQMSVSKDQNVNNILKDNVARIKAMMLVNENLNPEKNNNSVLFSPANVITKISSHLKQIFNNGIPVQINIDIDESIIINATSGLSLGLIITELITNSFKYAFPSQPMPVISITLNKYRYGWQLQYRDNGNGMITQKSDSFGLNLISDLTRQLRGSYKVVTENGVHYIFSFPNIS